MSASPPSSAPSTFASPSASSVSPSAPSSPRERLASAALYLCVDARRHLDDGRPRFTALRELAQAACAGGVDIIQLRDKDSPGERTQGPLDVVDQLEALAVLREVVDDYGALLAVNDRADLAVAAGADVCHMGQRDLPPTVTRRLVGPDMVLGRSCHVPADVDGAVAAAAEGTVDYFCTGPVWATPTKPGRTAVGTELVAYAARTAPETVPWFAIGGIDERRVGEVTRAGGRRIVVVRALTEQPDAAAVTRAAQTLRASV